MNENEILKGIDIAELSKRLEAENINLIPVVYTDLKSATFIKGDFETFINSVKLFKADVVFFHETNLEGEDFFYDGNEKILGEYETNDNEEISLTQFVPELEEFREFIGKINLVMFSVFFQNRIFGYWFSAEWYDAFSKLTEKADKILEEKESVLKAEAEQQKITEREALEQRETHLRKLIEGFADDDKIVSLKTQKAQLEYMTGVYPEIKELDPYILKECISNLNAKIQAKRILNDL